MMRLAIVLVLALAGCGGGGVPKERGPSSMALFEPSRFAGVWHVVAAEGPGCGPLAETWAPIAPGRFRVTGTECGPAGARAFMAEARVTGPGRLTLSGGRGEAWVLWVDADYRVAALAQPDGAARIVARSPRPPDDLLRAARDVIDFNGFDAARLGGS